MTPADAREVPHPTALEAEVRAARRWRDAEARLEEAHIAWARAVQLNCRTAAARAASEAAEEARDEARATYDTARAAAEREG